MKNPIYLAVPAMLFCALVATPVLASPTGTITSAQTTVTQPTHVYPGSSPMLNLIVKTTVHNMDSTTDYADTSAHLTFNNGLNDGGYWDDPFTVSPAPGPTGATNYRTTEWDNMCNATTSYQLDVTLYGATNPSSNMTPMDAATAK